MDVIPFQGYRYDSAVVGSVSDCLAPPYDVIDAAQRRALHERSPHNIAHIIKGAAESSDDDSNNVYSRAAAKLTVLIEDGAIKQDGAPCLYAYAQDFSAGGQSYRRTGFVGLGKLESYGGAIKPHEQTLAGPKADRLNLTRATKAQFGQIFMLYDDPERTADEILARACEGEELLCYEDDEQVLHRLFAVEDAKEIAAVQEVMASHDVFIADGHHRYETALAYYDETKNPAAAYRMMTFVNTHNEGLVVLPTHRLIKNVADFDGPMVVGRTREQFDVARLAFGDVVEKRAKLDEMFAALKLEFDGNGHAMGMYFGDGAFYVATLRDVTVMAEVAPDHSQAWRRLDVSILHKLVLEHDLGIDEAALKAQTNVEYIKDIGDADWVAVDAVDEGRAQGMFFLNPTRIEEVEAVAAAGEKMPQKSTFFYPKIFSGLVVNVLEQT